MLLYIYTSYLCTFPSVWLACQHQAQVSFPEGNDIDPKLKY